MRIEMAGTGRPQYFDRILKATGIGDIATINAPQLITLLCAYTVPANRAAIVSEVHIFTRRSTAAAPASVVQCYARYTAFGLGALDLVFQSWLDNTLFYHEEAHTEPQLYMGPGDKIEIFYSDASTGGSVFHSVGVAVQEFDQ